MYLFLQEDPKLFIKSRTEERSMEIKRNFIRSMMNDHDNYMDAEKKPIDTTKFNRVKLARLKYKVY